MRPVVVLGAIAAVIAVVGTIGALLGFPSADGSPMDAGESVRERVARVALRAVGLTASGDPTAFEQFLGGPGESPQMMHDMALSQASSTCGLVARAILREAGFTDARLHAPYRIGSAITDLRQLAIEAGAWIVPGPGVPSPKKGDVVMGDVDKPSGHVWTLTSADPAALTFQSVDGGVRDVNGRQSVAARSRRWAQAGDVVIDTPSLGNQHRITGWVDVAKLAAHAGAWAA